MAACAGRSRCDRQWLDLRWLWGICPATSILGRTRCPDFQPLRRQLGRPNFEGCLAAPCRPLGPCSRLAGTPGSRTLRRARPSEKEDERREQQCLDGYAWRAVADGHASRAVAAWWVQPPPRSAGTELGSTLCCCACHEIENIRSGTCATARCGGADRRGHRGLQEGVVLAGLRRVTQ